MSRTLENATRAAHSFYSNTSVSDICDSATKIIDITLPTRGIISENLLMNLVRRRQMIEFQSYVMIITHSNDSLA
jgi:hypothetical protein